MKEKEKDDKNWNILWSYYCLGKEGGHQLTSEFQSNIHSNYYLI